MESILILFLIIVITGGLVLAYIYYLKEKSDKLQLIQQGICPDCRQKTIGIADKKNGGCSGISLVQFECLECGYKNSFSIKENSLCNEKLCKR